MIKTCNVAKGDITITRSRIETQIRLIEQNHHTPRETTFGGNGSVTEEQVSKNSRIVRHAQNIIAW